MSVGTASSVCVLALALTAACTSCRSRDGEGALDAGPTDSTLAGRLREMGASLPDARLRVHVLVALGRASGAVERLEEAEAQAALQQLPSDREEATRRIALAYSQIGRFDRALALARALPESSDRSDLLAAIAEGLARARKTDEATAAADLIASRERREGAKVAIVKVLVGRGDEAKALAIAGKLEEPKQRNGAIVAILSEHARAHRFRRAHELTGWIESGIERSEAFAAIASGYYRAGRARDAMEQIDLVESAWIRARAIADIAAVAEQKKRGKAARELLSRALETARDIGDAPVRAAALGDVARACIDAGWLDDAAKIAADTDESSSRAKIRARLVEAYAARKRLDLAEATATALEDDALWGPEGIGHLARALASAGRFADAIRRAAAIRSIELRIPVLAEIAVMQAKLQKPAGDELVAALRGALDIPRP